MTSDGPPDNGRGDAPRSRGSLAGADASITGAARACVRHGAPVMTPSHSVTSGRASLSLLSDFELRYDDEHVDVLPGAQRLIGFLALQDGRPAA